jgi:hypothetical protein
MKDKAVSEKGRGAAWHGMTWNGMGVAWHFELAFKSKSKYVKSERCVETQFFVKMRIKDHKVTRAKNNIRITINRNL